MQLQPIIAKELLKLVKPKKFICQSEWISMQPAWQRCPITVKNIVGDICKCKLLALFCQRSKILIGSQIFNKLSSAPSKLACIKRFSERVTKKKDLVDRKVRRRRQDMNSWALEWLNQWYGTLNQVKRDKIKSAGFPDHGESSPQFDGWKERKWEHEDGRMGTASPQ